MNATNRNLDTTTAPAEEPAAKQLRNTLTQFNAGARERTALSREDRATMDRIRDLASAYQTAARSAWSDSSRVFGANDLPPGLDELRSAIENYLRTTTGTVTLAIASTGDKASGGDQVDEVPVLGIETPGIRTHLEKVGTSIVEMIDALIERGYARIASRAARRQELNEAVERWMGDAFVGPLLRVCARLQYDPPQGVFAGALPFGDLVASAARLQAELRPKATTLLSWDNFDQWAAIVWQSMTTAAPDAA